MSTDSTNTENMKMSRSHQPLTVASVLAMLAVAGMVGCGNKEAGYCFPDGDCSATSTGGSGGSAGSAAGGSAGFGGSINPNAGNAGNAGSVDVLGGSSGAAGNAGAAGGTCDTTSPKSCGTCDNDCTQVVANVPISAITCASGKCGYAGSVCAANYHDADGDPSNGCEVGPCKKTTNNDATCDGIDNDCDGKIDEDVDLCAPTSCGSCKKDCGTVFPNAVGSCVKDAGAEACTELTVSCKFDKAKCKPGFYDANNNEADGCEYSCVPRNSKGEPLGDNEVAIEICGDNIDNDCDGKIDADDDDTKTPGPRLDPQLCNDPASCTALKECFGGDKGVCAATPGKLSCQPNGVVCAGGVKPGEQPEICDNLDNDCNGINDDGLTDTGACGMFSKGKCRQGQLSCENGTGICLGSVEPDVEVCNNVDDDCDDIVDGSLSDGDVRVPCTSDNDCVADGRVCRPLASDGTKSVCANISTSEGAPCDVPPGTTNPCKAGVFSCVNAALVCKGAVGSTLPDACGVDSNCDGILTNQPDTKTDPQNCGACGNDCFANSADHVNWLCVDSQCVKATGNDKCQQGYIDCDGNGNDCERACTFLSAQEVCNGVDDNCDCNIDESKTGSNNGIVVPTVDQACGVSAGSAAVDPACGAKSAQNPGGIDVKCEGGKFVCTYPAGHCTTTPCVQTPDLCDGLDNNCDGTADNDYKAPIKTADALGAPCASDDGKGTSDGECRATGTYVCSPDKLSTTCSVKGKSLKCGVVPGDTTFNQKPCDEVCDGKDNDCDGSIDEPRLAAKDNPFGPDARQAATGAGTGTYMKPAVVKIGPSVWMHQYEVTRPRATTSSSGNGNGFWGGPDTPTGTFSDRTAACNEPVSGSNGRIPWFNVTPVEVEETCNNMGGRICKQSEWKAACNVNATVGATPKKDCTWGYGTGCQASGPTKCNIQPFNGATDSLLQVASPLLSGCFSDWSGSFTSAPGANPAQARLFDITGNLREITIADASVGKPVAQRQYVLMGGAFNTVETGATCDFSFYTVQSDFQLFSVGFRCCFDEYPD